MIAFVGAIAVVGDGVAQLQTVALTVILHIGGLSVETGTVYLLVTTDTGIGDGSLHLLIGVRPIFETVKTILVEEMDIKMEALKQRGTSG
jgi:hypothetical protein